MTLNIDLTAQEAAWLASKSAEQGVPAADIVRQLIDAQVPDTKQEAPGLEGEQVEGTNSLFAQWAKEDATPALDAKTLETIAWLDARIEEGKSASPEERRLADLEVEELLQNLKANREMWG